MENCNLEIAKVIQRQRELLEQHKRLDSICSLCYDGYDSDWGGVRWIRGNQTFCPECGKKYSGKQGNPISAIPHPFLANRLERRNMSRWKKFKKKLWSIIYTIGYYQ